MKEKSMKGKLFFNEGIRCIRFFIEDKNNEVRYLWLDLDMNYCKFTTRKKYSLESYKAWNKIYENGVEI